MLAAWVRKATEISRSSLEPLARDPRRSGLTKLVNQDVPMRAMFASTFGSSAADEPRWGVPRKRIAVVDSQILIKCWCSRAAIINA